MASQPWRMPASTATLTGAVADRPPRARPPGRRAEARSTAPRPPAPRSLRAASSFCAATAMATSEPVANSDTLRASPSAGDQLVGAAAQRLSRVKALAQLRQVLPASAPARSARALLPAPAASTRRSRPCRRAGTLSGSGWRAAPRGARPAGGSGRPRRARWNRGSAHGSTRWPISAASRIAGRQ